MEFTSEWLIRLEKPEVPLEKELARFHKDKQVWLDAGWEGKWIMIHCNDYETYCGGPYNTFERALEEGYIYAGLKPFLVRQILTKEKVYRC